MNTSNCQNKYVMDTSNFQERLKFERKRLGLNQEEAGDLCGVRRETWSKYELGQIMPGCDVLVAFAAAGADANYLLTGIRSSPPNEDEPLTNSVDFNKKKINNLFDDITPKQQAEVIKIVEEKKRLNQCEIALEELKKSTG